MPPGIQQFVNNTIGMVNLGEFMVWFFFSLLLTMIINPWHKKHNRCCSIFFIWFAIFIIGLTLITIYSRSCTRHTKGRLTIQPTQSK